MDSSCAVAWLLAVRPPRVSPEKLQVGGDSFAAISVVRDPGSPFLPASPWQPSVCPALGCSSEPWTPFFKRLSRHCWFAAFILSLSVLALHEKLTVSAAPWWRSSLRQVSLATNTWQIRYASGQAIITILNEEIPPTIANHETCLKHNPEWLHVPANFAVRSGSLMDCAESDAPPAPEILTVLHITYAGLGQVTSGVSQSEPPPTPSSISSKCTN